MYGTLLGAVRHKGFIPWDDDIDIGMMRSDYEKLIRYFSDNPAKEEGLRMDHMLTNEDYRLYIARISETKNITTQKYKSGLFVDIYPIDGITGLEWEKSWQKKYIHAVSVSWKIAFDSLKGINIFGRVCLYACAMGQKLIRKAIALFSAKSSFRVNNKLLTVILRKFLSNNSEYCAVTFWAPAILAYKKEWFAETVYMDFEDFKAPAPVGYDGVLRVSYGDYMQLPPEGERVPHHEYSAYKP